MNKNKVLDQKWIGLYIKELFILKLNKKKQKKILKKNKGEVVEINWIKK